MFEKVNTHHPDKAADRIGGALVDMAYARQDNPKIAVEVLIGHGICHIIAETSVNLPYTDIVKAVRRISGIEDMMVMYDEHPQDTHLADNQSKGIKCGDNGIFKGVPMTDEQKELAEIARHLDAVFGKDGKYILNGDKLTVCQSNATEKEIREALPEKYRETAVVNPLGYWTGGPDTDTGITGRKLGSDMGDAVTGGSINAKDLSKADVSVNIYCHLKAQETGEVVEMCCAIGDTEVNGVPYSEIVETAREYIKSVGGFERFSEWGLIR